MDLIKQNKFIGWVIGILIALNILTLTIIWIQSDKRNSPPINEGGNPPPGSSVKLLQNEIGLSDEQANRFQKMQKDHRERTKEINDELDNSKLLIADEIFSSIPDEKKIDSLAGRVGILQSKIEIMRFQHFRDLAQICNSEQKEKLRPILREVFGKKSPNDKSDIKTRPETKINDKNDDQRPPRPDERPALKSIEEKNSAEKINDRNDDRRPPLTDGKPTAPPSVEGKLNRYAEKLSLTPEQIKKAGDILKTAESKREVLRMKVNPDQNEIELEKNKISKEEDESISQILDQNQKKEFEKMVKNRGK